MKRIYLKRRKPFRGGETVYDRNILSIFKKVYDCNSYLWDAAPPIRSCLGLRERDEAENTHCSRIDSLEQSIQRRHKKEKMCKE